ncbi:dTDP-4-dehydrorhamnose reductase [soil metagenome]
MITVLVLGSNGQLGQCFQRLSLKEENIDWLFVDSSEVNITSGFDVQQCFNSKQIDYCINCAAYTNVEKAESEPKKAFLINAGAVKNLAEICRKSNSVLFHFSTDYVFKGGAEMPYVENDPTGPLNVYGKSKLKGEEVIIENANRYFIFRTSWLYSQYGHNFFKTILAKAGKNEDLNITTAQRGAPTNANHLAKLVLKLIKNQNADYGIYHFSNTGETTWYGFAKEILRISGNSEKVNLTPDNSYKTIAERPGYSVLNTSKGINTFDFHIPSWEEALEELYLDMGQDK